MRKIVQTSFFFLFLSAFLITGCKKENMCDCIKRTGDIISETRSLSGFDRVVLVDNVNVFIAQDTVFEVRVEAGENIVPLIKTIVEDGTLTIRNDNRCNWTRSYKKPMNVYVKMPELKYITNMGTAKITGLNTITKPLELETKNSGDIEFHVNNSRVITHMFGYGDIILHGTSAQHDCSIGGDGFLYAADLHTGYTWLETFTSGLCYIYANDLLIVNIKKKGDVYCYGHPVTVDQTISGEGHLYIQ
jgi:hypothetical protein